MVKIAHVLEQLVKISVIDLLIPPRALGRILHKVGRGVAKRGGSVEHRRHEGVLDVVKDQTDRVDLHLVVLLVVRAARGKVFLILIAFKRAGRHRNIPLRRGIADLDIICQQILGEQPACQDLLGILLVENAHRRALRDHFYIIRIRLRDRPDHCLKIHDLVLTDVEQRRVRSHPGRAGGRIHREQALPRVQEVCRIARDLKGRKCAAFRVFRNLREKFLRRVIEQEYFPCVGRITAAILLKHLDQHVVG